AYVAASITVPTVDGTTQTSESHGLGEWEKVSGTAPTGQIFPGKITGYSSTEGGLKIEAYQHELDKGKQVQVVGTRTYDGDYTVLQVKKETGSFVVQRSWADSEAVDVIADQVKRRRGLVLDGKHDWLECPFAKRQNLSQGFTLETWVKRVGEIDGVLMSSGPGAIGVNADEFGGMRVLLGVRGGRLYCALHPYRFDGFVSVTPLELVADATSTIASNEWVHVACIYDGRKLALVHNGKEIQVLRAKDMAVYARRIVEGDRTKLDERVKDELRIRRTMLIQDSTLVKFPKHHPRFYDAVRLVVGENVLSQEKDGFVAVPESERLNQRWKVEQQDGGLFTIRNLQTKQNLAYHYYDPSNVLQLDDKWNLKLNQDDTYDLVSQHGENLLSLTRQGTLIFTTPGAAATGPASNPTSWRIKPYGDSRLQLLRRTIKAADARSKSSKAYFPVKSLVLAANVERQSSPGVMGPADRLFDGQMAEARFWKIARTAKDIENAQHLQLGGHEPGLAGYWRLGGVSIDGDGKRKTVFDFSSNTNHAIVHGAPYAGAREVLRAFGSAKTPTAWLTNAGLFAVREGGEYEEYFEFKPDNKIDINGEKPFKPSVWGRLTAQSENIYFKDPEPPENYTFADIGEGWYSARIRFTIPQGVRLLRLFELKDLQGEWKKLELRRPRLTIDWDKVTCATAQEKALLKALPGEEDCGQQLDELESLEKQEDVLIHRRNELKHLIQLAEAPKDDVALKAAHEAIKNQKGIIAPLQTQYDEEGKDPRFNWTCLKLDKPDGKYLTAYNNLRMFPYGPYPDQLWRFEPSGKGDDSYFMSCKHEDLVGRVLDGHGEDSLGRQPYMYPGKYNSGNATWEMWKLVKSQSNPNAWRIENCYNRNVLAADANVDDSKVCMWPASDQDNQRWLAVPYERIPEYSKCKNKLDEQNRNLKDLEKQYNPLFEAERLSDEGLANLKSELGSVEQKLKTLNAQLGPKHTTYLAAPAGIGGTREMMELADQHDRHGLKVTGAILPFVKPGMPLYAHESCTGRVGITYQDTRFNLRTVSYNSVFDSDGRGEEWLPSSQGGSLMVRNPLPLPASVFNTVSGQVTIEFWARNVSTEAKRNVVLCASGPGDARLTIALPHHPDAELMWEAGAPRVNAEPGLPKDRDSLKFPVGAGK
ncbi:MAG: LamG-like jellyroll fold domain-containing protein, partial [Hyphomicrobium sp.]